MTDNARADGGFIPGPQPDIPTTYRGCVFPVPPGSGHVTLRIMNDLAGSYDEEGIALWFHRRRTPLGGLTPAEVLARFDPDSDEVEAVARLARETG